MNHSKFAFTRLCTALAFALAFSATASAADETARYVVEFKPGMAAAARQALTEAGGRVKLEIYGGEAVAIELPKKKLDALRKHAAIAEISEDQIRVPYGLEPAGAGAKPSYLPGQTIPYGISMVQADKLPDTYTANRTVCIIDSGYDLAHEDLHDNNVDGEYDAGTGWWYTDENHHGTHVAGTIAAINNSGIGVVGVNPNKHLHLHIVKVFGADGWAYSSTLAHAAKLCRAAGANIISMSLGGGAPNAHEQKTFAKLYADGILSIAAAGNGGNTDISYPAGYKSVVSVAAVDSNKQWASFSQYNADVELSGPGVSVLSTVPMGTGLISALTVGTSTYAPGSMDGSPKAAVTAPLADFGLGDAVNPDLAGKVCLIARGSIPFSTKIANCEASGGVGAVVYNNVAGGFAGTLNGAASAIPSVTASDTEGAQMLTQLGQDATVSVSAWNYAYFSGTSMATPHVSGVAALVWSYFPECTNAQIRHSLEKSALDIGDPGRDDKTGYGLVQAKAAYDRISRKGCGN
jgi:subtilisin family serine protease